MTRASNCQTRVPEILGFALSMAFSQQSFAINKCVDREGRISYQEAACPTSSSATSSLKTWQAAKPQPQQPEARRVEPNLQLSGPPEAAQLLSIYRRWADAEKLAMSTSRIALAGPAASMQALLREAEALTTPACLDDARKPLLDLLSKSSNAILQFMGKQEVTGMAYQLLQRPELIQAFEKAVTNAKCG
ncbi:DUF4124 domain-containing protein [Paracidovorax wautersii]|uniref:DUF4124 domain-containing protein n=1 Tax=Paracidovorax wautersii TaxID=1177982 RepID=UPI0011144730|nr:hypothetical protein [Paracidovorax wautersii]